MTTEPCQLPEQIEIDGEPFKIVRWHKRGIVTCNFIGDPHALTLLPSDGQDVLDRLIEKAREQIRILRDSAASHGATWPRPEPGVIHNS